MTYSHAPRQYVKKKVNKIKYNKVNTIKLSNFYSLSLEKDDYSERVLKNYLTYNDIDKEVVEKLINI